MSKHIGSSLDDVIKLEGIYEIPISPIIKEEIKEILMCADIDPSRVVGFLDGLVAASAITGEKRDELIEASPLLKKYLYG